MYELLHFIIAYIQERHKIKIIKTYSLKLIEIVGIAKPKGMQITSASVTQVIKSRSSDNKIITLHKYCIIKKQKIK